MKKRLLVGISFFVIFIVTGCASKENALLTCTATEKYSFGGSLVDTYYENKLITTSISKTEDQAKDIERQYMAIYPDASINRSGKKVDIVIKGSYTKKGLESIKVEKEKENIYICEWN